MSKRLSMSYTAKVLLQIILPMLVLGLMTQGCSSDGFVAQGNGQPYEGVSVDDGTSVPDTDESVDVTPAQQMGGAGYVRNAFTVEYACVNENSRYLYDILFGYHPNGDARVLVRIDAGAGYAVDWSPDATNFPIHRQFNDGPLLMDIYVQQALSPTGGTVAARYKISDSQMAFEFFSCFAVTQ